MSEKMAVRCPWCVNGEEMLYRERRTPGTGYGFAGRYECPVCGSRAPEIHNAGIDRADLREAAYAAAMKRWVEPNRVLTLDEVAETLERIEPAYLEIKGVRGGAWMGNGDQIYAELRDGWHGSTKEYLKNHEWDAEYGKTWRAWLRRPTDEERAGVAWE